MYGNPTFDCAGAQLHAVCRQLATVVTVDGVIDDANIERVTALARRFVLAEKPFVLDLSGVSSCGGQVVSLMYDIDDCCFHAGVAWSVVTSDAVARVLSGAGVSVPVAESVPDALNRFADSIDQRRRLLPLLTSKTA
ncbi:anti-anti-sigma factor [Mycolicibacterium sp. GF69]|uniref:STAS domain-containing protein n=1 Tax=Mycolicibacterium sp. GF69 TaxID=2267251 RepID=UPI000DCD1ABE|nr:STAS domain-containing protein [Mycolicibacterium sp. GF69]RAV18416.1 anti-anti-sigma factor [Mycolicibacterium sp. GF69]